MTLPEIFNSGSTINDMLIYHLAFLVVAILGFFSEILNNERYSNLFNKGYVCLLTALSGCRALDVGADTLMWVDVFENIGADNFLGYYSLEQGYAIINLLIYKLNPNGHFFVFVMALFTTLPICLYILKNGKSHAWMGFLVFIGLGEWMGSMYVMRQYCAISLCLLSLHYVVTKKTYKSIALIVLATFFHRTAAYFIFIIFLEKYSNCKRLILYSMIFSVISIFAGESIIRFIGGFTRINYYILGTELGGGRVFYAFLFIVITLPIVFRFRELIKSIEYKMLLLAFATAGLSFTMGLVYRANLYYNVALYIVIPLIIVKISKNRTTLLAFSLVFISLCYIGFVKYLTNTWVTPYRFLEF